MKRTNLIPNDATHKVEWCGDSYLFKREVGVWYTWSNGSWQEAWGYKIYWMFGWWLKTYIGSTKHNLIKIKRTNLVQ